MQVFVARLAILSNFSWGLNGMRFQVRKTSSMFKAIGVLIVLWGLSHFFSTAFVALDDAARESFELIETAAVLSQIQLHEI